MRYFERPLNGKRFIKSDFDVCFITGFFEFLHLNYINTLDK